MGFFDRFKKKNEVVSDVIINKYYKGYDSFYYVYDGHLTISLRICNQVNLGSYSNLYECDIRYGHTGAPVVTDLSANEDLFGFDKLIIGLDKERMIDDSNYAEFVFSKILDRNRILNLHDIEFELSEGKKNGNYVGSVMETDGQLTVLMDDKIGSLVEKSPDTESIHELYEKYMYDKAKMKAKYEEDSSIKRQEKIDRLKKELENLTSQEEEYQSSKNK